MIAIGILAMDAINYVQLRVAGHAQEALSQHMIHVLKYVVTGYSIALFH